ncbi:hypothetical protein niasHT_022091 [Heterodera trifolii]|uniref:Uncharacterized protein n=1 Tax=Heterodera trifolii TaxID=157864 RepID=A0ABD2KAT7_9BILA
MTESDEGTNWVESHPCRCGAKNWTASHMERVMVKLCCGSEEVQNFGNNNNGAQKNGTPERKNSLAPPEHSRVRRRSINNWRPIAGIFAVSPKEEDFNDCVKSHQDSPHEAIHVLFKCNKCSREFDCTYEIIADERGKRQSFGHYESVSEPITIGNCCNEMHSYEHIQRIFAAMWDKDKFQTHYNNCRHWSDGFWWKVHPDEYQKKKAAEEKMGARPLDLKS